MYDPTVYETIHSVIFFGGAFIAVTGFVSGVIATLIILSDSVQALWR